jgi:hypothetical protein
MQGMDSSRSKIAQRMSQLRLAFVQTKAIDPKLVPLLLGVCLTIIVAAVVVGVLTGSPVLWTVFGVLTAIMAGLLIFGRRTSTAAIGAIEGQPGAAAAVLQSARGWRVTPAVAFTRKQDFVHRAVGRGGIILVGEGAPARVSSLLKQEHRKVARVAGDAPIHEVNVGNGTGQIPLKQLQTHITKLPRKLKPKDVSNLYTKLAALGDNELPMPKGPMPRMKRR